MLIKGNTGAEAEIPIRLFDGDMVAVTGHSWATGDVKIYLPDGVAWIDATVANIVEKGRGYYALRLAASETDVAGKIYLDIDTTAIGGDVQMYAFEDDIIDPADIAVAVDPEDIIEALYATEHRTGRTFLGLLRRIDAVLAGKATGQIGTTVRYYAPDGVTAEIVAVQDTSTGARQQPDVTNSETP